MSKPYAVKTNVSPPEPFPGCPDESHCQQRRDQDHNDDEGDVKRNESDMQFAMSKTMRYVDQQVGDNDSGRVFDWSIH